VNESEFIKAAENFSADLFRNAYMEKVRKALASGGLDPASELNYATLKAIGLITAESFVDDRDESARSTLVNLRCFL
jgi:hypothetical protein